MQQTTREKNATVNFFVPNGARKVRALSQNREWYAIVVVVVAATVSELAGTLCVVLCIYIILNC